MNSVIGEKYCSGSSATKKNSVVGHVLRKISCSLLSVQLTSVQLALPWGFILQWALHACVCFFKLFLWNPLDSQNQQHCPHKPHLPTTELILADFNFDMYLLHLQFAKSNSPSNSGCMEWSMCNHTKQPTASKNIADLAGRTFTIDRHTGSTIGCVWDPELLLL